MRLRPASFAWVCAVSLALTATTACGGGGGGGKKKKAQLQFSSATFNVDETGGIVTITVSRTGKSAGPVGVGYTTTDGSATAGNDFTPVTGSLNWADGDTADRSFDITINDDALIEGPESFTVDLSAPTGGARLVNPFSATVTISDDDVPAAGAVQFTASAFQVNETSTTVTISAERIGGSAGAITVDFATADNTATAGSDYTASSGTLSWADGVSANQTFDVTILDDVAAEGDETIDLTLSNPTGGAALGVLSTATLTIVDDDSNGSFEFASVNFDVSAYDDTFDVTVRRIGGSAGAVTVDFATSDGTAVAGSDYLAASGMLSWADGDTADKTFNVDIEFDLTQEPNETINLSLNNPTGGANLGGVATSTITIVEDWTKNPANPVVTAGAPGAWDDDGSDEPYVLGPSAGLPQFMMWYRGDDMATGTEQIGLATSADGVNWTKEPTNPVLSPSGNPGDFDEVGVSGPSVLYEPGAGVFWMYYNGEDASGAFAIGLATSTDGINWTKEPTNPVLTTGTTGQWDEGAIAYCSVVHDGSQLVMFYSGVDSFGPGGVIQTGMATSPNGVTWTKSPSNPILSPDPTSFEGDGAGFPHALSTGPNEFAMVYIGGISVGSSTGSEVGFAFSDDAGQTWWKYMDGFGTPAPFLGIGQPGDWDERSIWKASISGDPSSGLFLWYEAEDNSGGSGIGVATNP